jgi:hypothetical protein
MEGGLGRVIALNQSYGVIKAIRAGLRDVGITPELYILLFFPELFLLLQKIFTYQKITLQY